MGLFYRLLGLVALIDDVLGSIVVYHIIRLNWIFFAIVLLYAFVGASALGLPWPCLLWKSRWLTRACKRPSRR